MLCNKTRAAGHPDRGDDDLVVPVRQAEAVRRARKLLRKRMDREGF